MDRLVVRNPVPQEVQSLDPILDVRSDQSGVTRTWMFRESSCECRDPKRREVRGRAQVPPEEVRAESAYREPVCNDGMIDCRHA